MISISNIYVQYGDRIVLNNINLVIGQRDKVGLVGRNGAGKSTLLKLIAGTEEPQSGNAKRENSIRRGNVCFRRDQADGSKTRGAEPYFSRTN